MDGLTVVNNLFGRSSSRKVSEYNGQHGLVELIAAEASDEVEPSGAEGVGKRDRCVSHERTEGVRLELVTREPLIDVAVRLRPLKHANNKYKTKATGSLLQRG